MKVPKLKPMLYIDECEEHGKTKFIVEQQELNVKAKTFTFVFYCKKCWLAYGNDCIAWKSTVTIDEYNTLFGFDTRDDN